jgi:protein lin-28
MAAPEVHQGLQYGSGEIEQPQQEQHNGEYDPTLQKGTIKWFDNSMGYGYINPAAGGNQIFVHKKHLRQGSRSLKSGVVVEYHLIKEGDKDVARDVYAAPGSEPEDKSEEPSSPGRRGRGRGGKVASRKGVDPVFEIPARFRGPQDENERIPYDGRNARPADAKFEKGYVKWFDAKKGYGFIAPADGSQDVFVHQSVIHAEGFRRLEDGQEVEYVMTIEGDKHIANNVTGLNGAIIDTSNMRDQKKSSRRERSRERDGPRRGGGRRGSRRDRSPDFFDGPLPRGAIQTPEGPKLDRATAPAGSSVTERKGYTRAEPAVYRGQVTWFDSKKGYGFITPDVAGENVFVHQSEIFSQGYRTLTTGEPVEYSLSYNEKNESTAINVTAPGGIFLKGERPRGGRGRDRDRDRDRGRDRSPPPPRKRRRGGDYYDDYFDDYPERIPPPPPRGGRGAFRTTVVQPGSSGSAPSAASPAPRAAASPAPRLKEPYAPPVASSGYQAAPAPYNPYASSSYAPPAAPSAYSAASAAPYGGAAAASRTPAARAPTATPYGAAPTPAYGGSYGAYGAPAAAPRPAYPAPAAPAPYGYNPYAR